MIHKMFVIYDSKANAYMQPWFLTQEAMAQRAFADCVNDADHNFGRHPEDYTLFAIGDFDDQSAKVQWTPPISFGNGIQYKKTKTQTDQQHWIDIGEHADKTNTNAQDVEITIEQNKHHGANK